MNRWWSALRSVVSTWWLAMKAETGADLLNLCLGTFLYRVWLLLSLESGTGVIQACHGALHTPLLNDRLQLTDTLLVVSHL